jgi:alcohol dehydrogenase class IV
LEAREQMMYASMLAGIAFGNVGVHIPHAMSYSVASNCKQYQCESYPKQLIPHGISVILNAPSVVHFTVDACPSRHLLAADALGANIQNIDPNHSHSIAECLSTRLIELMRTTNIPNGLQGRKAETN